MQKAKQQWGKEHTQKITNTHLNDIAFYLFCFYNESVKTSFFILT